MLGQKCRAGGVIQTAIEHIFHCRITARQGVADYYTIRRGIKMGGIITLHQLDALLRQLRAHRRIDVGVGTADAITKLTRQHGDAAHERAADSQNMNMH